MTKINKKKDKIKKNTKSKINLRAYDGLFLYTCCYRYKAKAEYEKASYVLTVHKICNF